MEWFVGGSEVWNGEEAGLICLHLAVVDWRQLGEGVCLTSLLCWALMKRMNEPVC